LPSCSLVLGTTNMQQKPIKLFKNTETETGKV